MRLSDLTSARIAGYAMFLSMAMTSGAMADAIDGDWCNKEGEHLTINGPKIVTPGGTNMTGDYDRHGFSYVPPAGEKHATNKLVMRQFSEELMKMRLPDGTDQEWRRCEVVS